MELHALRAHLKRQFALADGDLRCCHGGKNSRVFRLIRNDAEALICKVYFTSQTDTRDRFSVETNASAFMWRHGIRCIPRLIGQDALRRYALYGYVDGQPVEGAPVAVSELDALIDFLVRLGRLTQIEQSRELPPASEACFSLAAIAANLEKRLGRLLALDSGGAEYASLHSFLRQTFLPCQDHLLTWCRTQAKTLAIDWEGEIPIHARTLSPSDIGFHNALRQGDGSLVFFDFEYFGWDDPAKMLADLTLHPRMDLPAEQKRYLFDRLAAKLNIPGLIDRSRIAYPLFGLKWALIMLNEFIPSDYQRRAFASPEALEPQLLRVQKLAAAKKMLEQIHHTFERFPHAC